MTDIEQGGLFPHAIYTAIQSLTAGDRILLPDAVFDKPMILRGLRGTREAPIVIEGALVNELPEPHGNDGKPIPAVLQPWPLDDTVKKMTAMDCFGTKFRRYNDTEEYRPIANKAALLRENGGHYPVPALLTDQAMIALIDCQHVIIRNIGFEECWPTAIYLSNCQHIALDHLGFAGGTVCIGANDSNTHDLLVQNCRWYQSGKFYEDVTWKQVHGSIENGAPPVNLSGDHRHLDGDFFRAWNIFGNVVIRNNWISSCFNGIHFFTSGGGVGDTAIQTRSATNVLIENNVFHKVRDNCVEPEDFAWNWVVRGNRFDACYIPFSLEMQRFGSFYIYANAGVLETFKGAAGETDNNSSRLFKLKKQHRPDAPSFMFHNSWRLRKKHLGKRIFGGLNHFNNAIQFAGVLRSLPGVGGGGGLLGDGLARHSAESEQEGWEQNNFTRRWQDFGIAFDGDLTNDRFVNGVYNLMGYFVGESASSVDRIFAQTTADDFMEMPFMLSAQAEAAQAPVPISLELPRRYGETNDGKHQPRTINIGVDAPTGAIQKDGSLFGTCLSFDFLPDFSYLDSVLESKPIM